MGHEFTDALHFFSLPIWSQAYLADNSEDDRASRGVHLDKRGDGYVRAISVLQDYENQKFPPFKVTISRNFDQNLEKIEQNLGKIDQNLGKSLSKGPKFIKIWSIFDFRLGHTRHLANLVPPGLDFN